jgi:hypothetical protein
MVGKDAGKRNIEELRKSFCGILDMDDNAVAEIMAMYPEVFEDLKKC